MGKPLNQCSSQSSNVTGPSGEPLGSTCVDSAKVEICNFGDLVAGIEKGAERVCRISDNVPGFLEIIRPEGSDASANPADVTYVFHPTGTAGGPVTVADLSDFSQDCAPDPEPLIQCPTITQADCMCDQTSPGVFTQFKRITCYNPGTGATQVNDRTSDLTADYVITGTAVDCSEIGDDANLVVGEFCDADQVSFFRLYDSVSGVIMRQYDGSLNDFVPAQPVSAGSCGVSVNVETSGPDCIGSEEGVQTAW